MSQPTYETRFQRPHPAHSNRRANRRRPAVIPGPDVRRAGQIRMRDALPMLLPHTERAVVDDHGALGAGLVPAGLRGQVVRRRSSQKVSPIRTRARARKIPVSVHCSAQNRLAGW